MFLFGGSSSSDWLRYGYPSRYSYMQAHHLNYACGVPPPAIIPGIVGQAPAVVYQTPPFVQPVIQPAMSYNQGYPGQPYYGQPGYAPAGVPGAPPGVPPSGPFYPNAAYPAPPAGGYPPPAGQANYPPHAAPGYQQPPASQPYGAPPPPSTHAPSGAPPPIGFVQPPPLPQGYNSSQPQYPGGAPPPGAPYGGAPQPGAPYGGAPQPGAPYGGAPPPPASYPGAPPYNPGYGLTPPHTPQPGMSYPSVHRDISVNPSQPYAAYRPVEVVAPSIRAVGHFNAQKDCEVLRKAMKGFGTDEAALINVLCRRTWRQRDEIERTFKQMYGKSLEKDISSETSGNFRKVLLRLLKTPIELAAFELHEAVAGLGTDEKCLIEIVCSKTNSEIVAIKYKYYELYRRQLESDIKGDTSGHFRRLLVALLAANRSEDPRVDMGAVQADAQALYDAGERRLGTDESRFNVILCSRSYPHLRAVFDAYKRQHKKDIEAVIRSEFSGDIASGLVAIVSVVRNKMGYFASRLNKSIIGVGTRDTMLIRIVTSHCDFDLEAIKKEYQRMYGRTLGQDVSGDTSGDYRKSLLTLLGDQ